MRLRFFLMLCLIFIAALPLLADRIPYAVSTNDSLSAGTVANVTDHSILGIDVPVKRGSQLEPIVAPMDSDESDRAFDDLVSKFSVGADPFFLSSFGADTDAANRRDLAFLHIVSSNTHASSIETEIGRYRILSGARHHDNDPHHHAQEVPEPGSLPLLLMGLVAIGFLSLRHALLARNI